MKFTELKASFSSGKIDKPEFIRRAYQMFHETLFDYAANLGDTDVREISIDARGVVFVIRSSGIKVRCQLGDHRSPPVETFNFADFEPHESRMMLKLFEGGKYFYDIGANIGWHSLTLAARFRDAIFFCFEPIPKTYEYLQDNIALNAFDNIRTYNIALSNSNSPHDYYFYEACSGNASAVNLTAREDVRKVECPQTRLDDLVQESGPCCPPDFIKCDVEGAELLVFQGARETIARYKPVVMAEILRKWSAHYHYNPNEIFHLFAVLGYRAFTTDGYFLRKFSKMTEESDETNFFFLHAERHAIQIERFADAA